MRTELDYIIINGEQVHRPLNFAPAQEDIYKGDYTTCTGKRIGDVVGWRYADMTLEWDGLPQNEVDVLINMSGANTLEFDGLDGEICSEQVLRTSVVALRHRYTQNGVTFWRNVKVSIQFINSHT